MAGVGRVAKLPIPPQWKAVHCSANQAREPCFSGFEGVFVWRALAAHPIPPGDDDMVMQSGGRFGFQRVRRWQPRRRRGELEAQGGTVTTLSAIRIGKR